MSAENKPCVACTACEMISCREYKDNPGARYIKGADGSAQKYDESILGCKVLREEYQEEYLLWLLGWTLLKDALNNSSV
jgi:hypothetical protein